MDCFAGRTDWNVFFDKFCTTLGDSQLAHFQNCEVKASREDNLKLCGVLSNNVGSLRAETAM